MTNDRFKFRAWNFDQKKIISVNSIEIGQMMGLQTLMQSTGLKDKNGVLISEGDILQIGNFCPFEVKYELTKKSDFMGYGVSGFQCFGDMSKTEIIGNIHQNIELLKGNE